MYVSLPQDLAAFLFGCLALRQERMSKLTWDDVDYRKTDRPRSADSLHAAE